MVNDGNIESPVIIVVLGICNVLPGTDNNYASFFPKKNVFCVFCIFSISGIQVGEYFSISWN